MAAAATLLAALLPGCGLRIPADPDGTLDRVESSGVIRAGAAPSPTWVEVDRPGRPTGHEVTLVEDFAESLDARVEWTVGTEEHLVTLFVSASIVRDGWKNLKFATGGLMDQRARTYDDREPHELNGRVLDTLRGLAWVADVRCRVRDMGHVFHVEAFVVGRGGEVSLDEVEQAVEALRALDWKTNDVVVMPVRALPEDIPAE